MDGARDMANLPQCPGQPPQQRRAATPNVSGAEAEKECLICPNSGHLTASVLVRFTSHLLVQVRVWERTVCRGDLQHTSLLKLPPLYLLSVMIFTLYKPSGVRTICMLTAALAWRIPAPPASCRAAHVYPRNFRGKQTSRMC